MDWIFRFFRAATIDMGLLDSNVLAQRCSTAITVPTTWLFVQAYLRRVIICLRFVTVEVGGCVYGGLLQVGLRGGGLNVLN
jgi:hypothetical protein